MSRLFIKQSEDSQVVDCYTGHMENLYFDKIDFIFKIIIKIIF